MGSEDFKDEDLEEGKAPRPDEFARMFEASFKTNSRKLAVGDKIKCEVSRCPERRGQLGLEKLRTKADKLVWSFGGSTPSGLAKEGQ